MTADSQSRPLEATQYWLRPSNDMKNAPAEKFSGPSNAVCRRSSPVHSREEKLSSS